MQGKQPETLLGIVLFANDNGRRVPSGKELAEIIGVGERGATERKSRIIKKFPQCFEGSSRNKKLVYRYIVTESYTAQNLLETVEILQSERDLTEGKLRIALESKGLDDYLKNHIRAKYLVRKKLRPEILKVSEKFFEQKAYIELLAKQ